MWSLTDHYLAVDAGRQFPACIENSPEYSLMNDVASVGRREVGLFLRTVLCIDSRSIREQLLTATVLKTSTARGVIILRTT